MQYDTIIDCPKSGGDLCYKVEVNKEITNYLSLSCGYWTNTLMKEGSEFYEEQLITLPELYKDISWKDPETELIWIPNTINIPELGMVFANGASADEWSWAAVKAVELEEGDEETNPLEGAWTKRGRLRNVLSLNTDKEAEEKKEKKG